MAKSSFNRPSLWLPTSTGRQHSFGEHQLRTIPSLVDFNAAHNPNYIFAAQAQNLEGAKITLLEITHREARDAILRCQEWLQKNVDELRLPAWKDGRVNKGPPLALLMESDVGLAIHQVALLGLGVPYLLLSARLNPLAIQKLLDTTSTSAILASPRLKRTAQEAIDLCEGGKSSAVVYERQAYSAFLGVSWPAPSHTTVCYPHYHTDENDRDVLILHSSGTTGFPKPIYQSHEYVTGFGACHTLSAQEAESRTLSTLPLYHGFGLLSPCLSLSIGLTVCFPVNSICSAANVVELLHLTKAKSMMTVPSVLDDLAHLEGDSALSSLRPLQFIAVGGGPLPTAVGEKLVANGVKVLNHFGATEVGALAPMFVPDQNYDFRYVRLRPDFDFKVETVDEAEGRCQLITFPFGWNAAFPLQDQLLRHPEAPETDFRIASRTDDVIVLATGEKILPGIIETAFAQHPECKTAVVVGQGRFEIGLLIELRQAVSEDEIKILRNHMWEFAQGVNENVDAHSRISSQSAIIFISSDKAIPRSDKRSVLRQDTYQEFELEINQMYEKLESSSSDSASILDLANLEVSIKAIIQERLRWKIPFEEWGVDDDLFELGMDSLQALQLRRLLNSAVASEGRVLDAGIIYRSPTVSKLATALLHGTFGQGDDVVKSLIQKYCPTPPILDTKFCSPSGHVVLLTGASGNLGSHLVQHLASLDEVHRIICLARKPSHGNSKNTDSKDTLRNAFITKGISLSKDAWSKIQVLQADFSQSHLGIGDEVYHGISSQVTHILHNGWPMDFNRQVESFEAQFRLTQELIQLARNCHNRRPWFKPTFLFVSSVAVVGRYREEGAGLIVPEIPTPHVHWTDSFGYAQAKLVCERIVEHSARTCGDDIDARYVRVGQLTGAQRSGIWNPAEHFPAMIKSSQLLSALPELSGTLSWLPVDMAAKSMVELLFCSLNHKTPLEASVFHLENPIRQAWEDILGVIASELEIPSRIPYDEWVTQMLAIPDDRMERNPAKKLADFFVNDFERMSNGQVVMATERTQGQSKTLRSVHGLGSDLVRAYVQKWREMGFLSR